ncbi:MAG: hypothetical protein JSV96_06235 [Candidatus Aminicenantes bacterium]|nr:MAG: hypothetical protein JSV96_06235 [Candidatus Aminicenantes bacterium]
MAKILEKSAFGILVSFVAASLIFAATSFAQEKKVDTQKLYKEIAGYYEFETPEGIEYITFWVEDGKLKAQADGDDEIVVLEPVEGKELYFEIIDQNGQLYELQFSRDEEGKITKCVVTVMGMEIEGKKIKDKNQAH